MMRLALLIFVLGLSTAAAGDVHVSSWGFHGGSGKPSYSKAPSWPRQYYCKHRGCFTPNPNPTPLPTAWSYISTHPKLTFLTKLLLATDLYITLDGPFDATLLAPTDEAWDKLFQQFAPELITVLGNDAERTGPYWKLVNEHFFPRLLNYHVLVDSLPAGKLVAGSWYDTAYSNANASPHKVQFNNQSATAPPNGPTTNRYAKPCRAECKSLQFYFRDEQNTVAQIETVDKLVQGGGVIHTIKSVLMPNDVFPSQRAALKFAKYTTLSKFLDQIAMTPAGGSIWQFIETTPSTLLAPTDEGLKPFEGFDVPSDLLLSVINFNLCPDDTFNPNNLLYTPFTSGINPCLTQLGKQTGNTDLKIEFTGSDGKYEAIAVNSQQPVNIVYPDVTTPLAVAHGVDFILIPPLDMPVALSQKLAQKRG